jgi:aryl-alcohol dehydrogenase-like predicted oxidoreductase
MANDPGGIRSDLETSLRLLQTDWIDLYYIHMPPDDLDGMNRDLDVFEQLRDEGKIRFIGASVKGPDVTQATVDLCRQYIDTGRVDAIQLIYSIFRQRTRDIFGLAQKRGVGLVGRTCLESGFLTGKYPPGHTFAGKDHRSRWGGERLRRILTCAQELREAAVAPPYETLAQVAIRFAMLPAAIATTIVGARTVDQTRANLAALGLPRLSPALVLHLIGELGHRTEEFNAA